VKILKNTEGIALFVAILVMTVVMLFLGASLFLSRVDTKISGNFKLGTQALEVADAGLQHSLLLLRKGWEFNDDLDLNCADPPPPCTILSSTTFPSGSDFTYSVTVENNSDGGTATNDIDNAVVLVSTANGPNSSMRQIQAYVDRSSVSFTPPSAVYIPASSGTVAFGFSKANNPGMFITGDDTSYSDTNSDGYADSTFSGSDPSIAGVSTIYDTVRGSILSALGFDKLSLVQGSGYAADPINPSLLTTADKFDVNKIAQKFFDNASTVKDLDGEHKTCSSSSPCVYGTDASPQITYIREGQDHIHLDGYVTGSGVMVTEGKSHLYGNFEFHGLVIGVKEGLTGGTDPGTVSDDYFSLRDNAKIFGGVLLGPTDGDLGFEIQSNGKVYYNSTAIDMANSLCGDCLPQPPKVFSWFDK
jgi:Tfp pilus assembly protein PilX